LRGRRCGIAADRGLARKRVLVRSITLGRPGEQPADETLH